MILKDECAMNNSVKFKISKGGSRRIADTVPVALLFYFPSRIFLPPLDPPLEKANSTKTKRTDIKFSTNYFSEIVKKLREI